MFRSVYSPSHGIGELCLGDAEAAPLQRLEAITVIQSAAPQARASYPLRGILPIHHIPSKMFRIGSIQVTSDIRQKKWMRSLLRSSVVFQRRVPAFDTGGRLGCKRGGEPYLQSFCSAVRVCFQDVRESDKVYLRAKSRAPRETCQTEAAWLSAT